MNNGKDNSLLSPQLNQQKRNSATSRQQQNNNSKSNNLLPIDHTTHHPILWRPNPY